MSVALGCRPDALSVVEAEIDGMNESSKEVDGRCATLDPLTAISHDPQAASGPGVPSASDQQRTQRELKKV
jgi:hypothetical protein